MKDIEIIDIDYSGTRPEYQHTDTFKNGEYPTPFIVPDQGPFYTRNFVLRGNGKPLTRGTDFVFEDYLEDMELLTGKTVCASLRLLQKTIDTYDTFSLTYSMVGKPMVSRKYLLDSAEKIMNNDTKVDWNTQVFGKPDTYPPAFHIHDVREKQEMVGFSDLVVLFKQFRGQKVKHGLDIWNRLIALRDATYLRMDNIYKARWKQLFDHIQNGQVPHPITKADLLLGSHPDYATATVEEDRLGERDDVLSTPKGLVAALEQVDVNVDDYLRQGSLPFSYYGTGIYIPPPISGSFEGLGTNTGGNALCVESNDWTVLLTRGFDSKVRRLYYYYNRDPYRQPENFIFSGYAYTSQVMENAGFEPNHVISGSSGRILMLGDKEQSQYYITLGNGTLDSQGHQLMKVNMAAFIDTDGVNMFNPDRAYVMMIGNWVYVVAQIDTWYPGASADERAYGAAYRRRSFYRIPVSDLYGTPGKEVTFVKQKMNYQNSEGTWLYNQDYVDVAKLVFDTSSGTRKIKSCVIDFDPAPDTLETGPWRSQWFNMEDPNDKTKAHIKLFSNSRYTYKHEVSVSGDYYWCLPYTFDTNSNTLTLDSRWFKITRNIPTGAVTVPDGHSLNEWYHSNISYFTAAHAEIASCFIPKLGFVAVGTNQFNLPYVARFAFYGYNKVNAGSLTLSDWEIFTRDLTNLSSNGITSKNVPMDSPFGFTTKPLCQRDLWEYNGAVHALPIEIYNALDGPGSKSLFYREAKNSYAYQEGPQFNFKYIANKIIGRTPTTLFGKVDINGMASNVSSRMPACAISSKDKYGVQYGMFNLISQKYNEANDYSEMVRGLANSDPSSGNGNSFTETGGSFKLGLLGKHTYNPVAKTLSVENIPGETLYITRANTNQLLQALLGDKYNLVTNGKGGNGPDGEFVMTCFFGAKEGTALSAYPSMAIVLWHSFSDPTQNKMSVITFNWTRTGNLPTGEKTIAITNIKYPRADFGQNGGAVINTNLLYNTSGRWGNVETGYGGETLQLTTMLEFTDQNNFEMWVHSGVNMPVPLNSAGSDCYLKVDNGTVTTCTPRVASQYNANSSQVQWQYVTDLGLCRPCNPSLSGGAAYYCQGGRIPADTFALMQAVFIEGNWTLFVNSDMTAVFNGSERVLPKNNWDLSEFGIDQKNKTFYLYAVSGKVEGYYDLTLSERTASPYHLLCATIKTNAFGIEQILIEQRFAISGFSISTTRKGGIVPASAGSVSDHGTFKTVTYADLFDTSKYN